MSTEETTQALEQINLANLQSDMEVEKQTRALDNFIKHSSTEFTYMGARYKIKKPSLREQDNIEKFKLSKKIELIRSKELLFENEWRTIYRERGIAIEDIEKSIKKLEDEKVDLEDRVIKANGSIQDKLVIQIQEKITKLNELYNQKYEMLEGTLENKIKQASNMYMLYCVLEIEDGVECKWKKMFTSYEDFMNHEDSVLLLTAFELLNALIFNYEG